MFRRMWPWFYAFDVLSINGRDLRDLPLLERKRRLRAIMPMIECRLLYLDHLAELGVTPGADVQVVARAPFGGPITLRIVREGSEGSRVAGRSGGRHSDRESAIGPSLAAQVFVESRRKREA